MKLETNKPTLSPTFGRCDRSRSSRARTSATQRTERPAGWNADGLPQAGNDSVQFVLGILFHSLDLGDLRLQCHDASVGRAQSQLEVGQFGVQLVVRLFEVLSIFLEFLLVSMAVVQLEPQPSFLQDVFILLFGQLPLQRWNLLAEGLASRFRLDQLNKQILFRQ